MAGATKKRADAQQELPLAAKSTWGGARVGAGRKPLPRGVRKGIRHERRPELARRHPLHVTLRMTDRCWNLRARRSFRLIEKALLGAAALGLRPTHYSVQGNHVHLIVEVESRLVLSRAMRSFGIRLARSLNAMMGGRGKVIADRYHAAVLDTPRRVRNAIRYVLSNTRKHAAERGETLGAVTFDPFAAGPADHTPPEMDLRPSPLVLAPRTWLLRIGWTRAARPPFEEPARLVASA